MVKIITTIYIDQELATAIKARGLNVSCICNNALLHEAEVPKEMSFELHSKYKSLFDFLMFKLQNLSKQLKEKEQQNEIKVQEQH